LIESVSDKTILDNLAVNASAKQAFRISGRPNRNGNDGTITDSAGRRRTPRCCCSPARHTTSRWA